MGAGEIGLKAMIAMRSAPAKEMSALAASGAGSSPRSVRAQRTSAGVVRMAPARLPSHQVIQIATKSFQEA